jgi:hypothetical protein
MRALDFIPPPNKYWEYAILTLSFLAVMGITIQGMYARIGFSVDPTGLSEPINKAPPVNVLSQ